MRTAARHMTSRQASSQLCSSGQPVVSAQAASQPQTLLPGPGTPSGRAPRRQYAARAVHVAVSARGLRLSIPLPPAQLQGPCSPASLPRLLLLLVLLLQLRWQAEEALTSDGSAKLTLGALAGGRISRDHVGGEEGGGLRDADCEPLALPLL